MHTLCRLLQIYCRIDADLYKCVQLEHFFCHTPSMHNMIHADFVHTYADIMQTLNRHYADYHTRVHLEHFSVVISGKFPYCAMVFAGPTWHQRDGSVLVASWRFDGSRSRKTKGSLADTLQCNIWRRAQTPHRMTAQTEEGSDASQDGQLPERLSPCRMV